PLPPRAAPARAPEIHPAPAVEADAFQLEKILLHPGPEAVAMAAAAGGIDHPLPRHVVDERPAERTERHAHGAGATRLPEDGRDLAVGHDLAARDAADDAVHQAVEGRRAVVVAAALHGWSTSACAGASVPANGCPSPAPSLDISTTPPTSTWTR